MTEERGTRGRRRRDVTGPDVTTRHVATMPKRGQSATCSTKAGAACLGQPGLQGFNREVRLTPDDADKVQVRHLRCTYKACQTRRG